MHGKPDSEHNFSELGCNVRVFQGIFPREKSMVFKVFLGIHGLLASLTWKSSKRKLKKYDTDIKCTSIQ